MNYAFKDKYGIYSMIIKRSNGPIIWIPSRELNKFIPLIEPYIIN
jgi:hypothetical protein